MKQFFTGLIVGTLITGTVFYFLNFNKEAQQKDDISDLLTYFKQEKDKNQQAERIVNDAAFYPAIKASMNILVADNNEYYYYTDTTCSALQKTNLDNIFNMLVEEMKVKPHDALMVIIKKLPGTTTKNSIQLLDVLAKAGLQPGQFAELMLSDKEKNCITDYKQNK